MRHAWLIIVHNEFEILQQLISLLDDTRSDFFIHFDKKVKVLPKLAAEKGRIYILDKRIDVRWGSISQIETELVLMETALKHGSYGHLHILSGTHLPLRTVPELLGFYDAHAEEEVVRYWPEDPGDADFKLRRYHFPLSHYKYGNNLQRRLCQLSWQAVIKVQKILGIRHLKDDYFIKTDNWLSLTQNACKYLVDNKIQILNKYRWSFCGDEYFVASELSKSPDIFKLFDCQQLLYVKFLGDTPRTFHLEDYPKLRQTGCLWARKFTSAYGN